MDQQEHATGAVQVAAGTSDGHTGGAGRGTTDACAAVRGGRPDGTPPQLRPGPPAPRPAGAPDPGLLLLAEWFAAADDDAAHDLFTAAFGLYGARHFAARGFGGRTAAAAGAGPAGYAAGVSWWHGPSVHADAAPADPVPADPVPVPTVPPTAAPVPAVSVPSAGTGRRGRHRRPEPARAPVRPQDHSTAAERRIAARLLLAHPLITAAGPHADGFPLLHRHRDWLTERFDTLLGYRLVIGPRHARLCKGALGAGGGRRLERPGTGEPFTPAEYSRLAVVLSVLVDAPDQLPLGRLVGAVRAAATATPVAAGPGRTPGPEADLAAALGVLTHWQVISATGSGLDTLDPTAVLTVDRELARALPVGAPALAAVGGPAGRAAEQAPATTVRRLLAETPVVLLDDLTAGQRAWLLEYRQREAGIFAEFLGLEAEFRAEGVALVDPADEFTDLVPPGGDTLDRAALLLVERLVEELRPLPGEPAVAAVPIPDALIDGALGDIADEYGLRAGWRLDYLADRTALRRDALDLLARMGLITPTPRGTHPPGWLLRAPAARYAPPAELLPAAGTGRHSRRDAAGGWDADGRGSAGGPALPTAAAPECTERAHRPSGHPEPSGPARSWAQHRHGLPA